MPITPIEDTELDHIVGGFPVADLRGHGSLRHTDSVEREHWVGRIISPRRPQDSAMVTLGRNGRGVEPAGEHDI